MRLSAVGNVELPDQAEICVTQYRAEPQRRYGVAEVGAIAKQAAEYERPWLHVRHQDREGDRG